MLTENFNTRKLPRAQRRRQARQTPPHSRGRAASPFILFALAVGLGLSSYPSQAATDSYTGPSGGEWGTAGNWNSGAGPVPGSGNNDAASNPTANAIDFNLNASIFSFVGNGAFTLTGGTLSGSQASDASTFQNNNTTTVNGGTFTNLTLDEGTGGFGLTFTGSGNNALSDDIINSDMTFNGGYARIYGANTENGAITLSNGGNLQLQDGNTDLTLGSTGSLNGSGTVNQVFSGATVTNNGTIDANSSGNTLTVAVSNYADSASAVTEATGGGALAMNNTNESIAGTVHAAGGDVTFSNGTLTAVAGSKFDADAGDTVLLNNMALSGEIASTTGAGLTFNTSSGNSIGQTGGFTLDAGKMGFVAGGSGYVRAYNMDTFGGAVDLSNGGNIELQGGNADLVLNGGLAGFGTVNQVFSGATVTNNSTLDADNSANTLTVAVSNFNDNAGGTAEATNSGALSLKDTTNTITGTVHAAGGDVTFTGGTVAAVAGSKFDADAGSTILLDDVTLSGEVGSTTGTGLTFSASPSNAISALTQDAGTLTFGSGSYARVYGPDTFNGAINTSGGNLQLQDGNADLILGSTGSLSGSGTVNQVFGGATVTNNGTIDASGGALNVNTSNLSNNASGTLQAENGGTLAVTSSTTDSGNILVKNGGVETFSQPALTQTGTGKTQVDGTLNVGTNGTFNLAGGELDGTGTVNASVTNTGGTVKAGDSPGTLTINGNFTNSASETILDEIAGFSAPNYGLLDVTGKTLLDPTGVLDVSFVNGFAPTNAAIGTVIPFLDYGSLDPGSLTAGQVNLSVDVLNDPNNQYGFTIGNNQTPGATSGDLFLTLTKAPAPVVVIPPTNPAVPEPSSLALLGLGGFALIGVARRRRGAASA